jgi:DNA adenine methylase
MKCLFLNRTTFSGILHGRAGPIGGRRQDSAFKIDCRFTKGSIERRLKFVGDLYKSNRLVDVWCKDWHTTLADVAEWYPQLLPNQIIAYLDPPYLERSARLYGRSFDVTGGYASRRGQCPAEWIGEAEHYRLAEYLRRKAQYRWLLSYDNHPALTHDFGLYASRRMTPSVGDRDLLNVRAWHISKRLVNLRYTAASNGPAEKEELLITALPPTTVPINERFRILVKSK